MLIVAVVAIPLSLLSDRNWQNAERCRAIADNHARVGAEYRRNGKAQTGMLRIDMLRLAEWHDEMRRRFEEAAGRPWMTPPVNEEIPPRSWVAPETIAVAKSARSDTLNGAP
jgi:hypothetical protein